MSKNSKCCSGGGFIVSRSCHQTTSTYCSSGQDHLQHLPSSCTSRQAGVQKSNRTKTKKRLSSVADVLDLTLGVPRHLLVQEEGHAAAVALAVDARDERLAAAARARQGRRGHHVGGGHRVRDGDGPHPETRCAGQLPRGPAVGARRELLHLVNFDLLRRGWAAGGTCMERG